MNDLPTITFVQRANGPTSVQLNGMDLTGCIEDLQIDWGRDTIAVRATLRMLCRVEHTIEPMGLTEEEKAQTAVELRQLRGDLDREAP